MNFPPSSESLCDEVLTNCLKYHPSERFSSSDLWNFLRKRKDTEKYVVEDETKVYNIITYALNQKKYQAWVSSWQGKRILRQRGL